MKNQVMQLAHSIKKSQNLSLSQALKIAWAEIKIQANNIKIDIQALKKALCEGIVLIKAKKVNQKKAGKTIYGEITERLATLDLANYSNPKSLVNQSENLLPFISITDNKEWRSFRIDHILGFEIVKK